MLPDLVQLVTSPLDLRHYPQRILWWSVPGAHLNNEGSVHFYTPLLPILSFEVLFTGIWLLTCLHQLSPYGFGSFHILNNERSTDYMSENSVFNCNYHWVKLQVNWALFIDFICKWEWDRRKGKFAKNWEFYPSFDSTTIWGNHILTFTSKG